MGKTQVKELRQLARHFGIQTSYIDSSGRRQQAAPESLLGVLRALGAPVEGWGDVASALRERRHTLRTRRVEPVVVAWEGTPAGVVLRLPAAQAATRLSCLLTLEDGAERAWDAAAEALETIGTVESEGRRLVARRLPLPERLPTGYHRLKIRSGGEESEVLIIAAPLRVDPGFRGPEERLWGVFCPIHALRGASSWGAGDFADLETLMDWIAQHEGGLVATLPLLASHIDEGSASVSPYAPASRLFWNEFYLDLARIPDLAHCAAARALLDSPEFRREVASLRTEDLVHFGRQMRLKRRVLELLADAFFAHESAHTSAFRQFVKENPEVEDYATFMAAGERHGRDWRDWPRPIRDLEIDERARRYHLFAQWQAEQQLQALSQGARTRQLTWYVDLPVGVDPRGYDVWSRPAIFAQGASVGCPPDMTFTKGQDWAFPPLHPERQRDQHYDYLIAALQCQFRHAGALRIDHVMGLHRLYWIPEGMDARHGAYVRYPAEEAYAILSVESHRRHAWVVGENLGTTSPEIERALVRHGVHGMYVVQYELRPDPASALREVPEMVIASVNTHDMPPFAAFWNGLDIEDRRDLGWRTEAAAAEEAQARAAQRRALITFLWRNGLLEDDEDDPEAVLRACWEYLGNSPAHVVLLNLEDFWLETAPQNVPNTRDERPNWRRKVRYPLDQISRMPAVLEALRRVADLRLRSSEAAFQATRR